MIRLYAYIAYQNRHMTSRLLDITTTGRDCATIEYTDNFVNRLRRNIESLLRAHYEYAETRQMNCKIR